VTETRKPNGAADPEQGAIVEPPLRASRRRARAAEWSLVLEAAGISHLRTTGADGFELRVAAADLERAQQTLDAYDQETARPERPAGLPAAEPYGRTWIGIAAAIALTLFFGFTGPSDGANPWSNLGSSAAERIFQGEVWRTVTALTLHVDPAHLLGNVLACLVFITFLGNRLGPGLAIWLTLLAGAFGNLLTAAITRDHHVSIGASTATFGALGGLVGLRATRPVRLLSTLPVWTALAAGAALFGMLGTGSGADVLAHLFGLLCGGLLGAAMALVGAPLRNRSWQRVLAFAATGAIALCWALAFSSGKPV
jgi:rhomboid protease GluP